MFINLVKNLKKALFHASLKNNDNYKPLLLKIRIVKTLRKYLKQITINLGKFNGTFRVFVYPT